MDATAHRSTTEALLLHTDVLPALLKHVEPLDFRAIVGLTGDGDKPRRNHYVVTVAEEVLSRAQRNGWGLCRSNSQFFVYNGAFWQVQPDGDVQQFLQKAAESMGLDKFEARFVQFGDLLVKQFMSTAHWTRAERKRTTIRINLANGTFRLSPGSPVLGPFDPADFLAYQLPFAYNPQAMAMRFQQFLDRVLPDADCQRLLAEYIGYLFVPSAQLKLEKTLLLYGSGANGKSVFFEVITAMLGPENVSHHSLQNLTVEPAYSRSNLENVLVNYASELGGKLDTNVFKQLVSGEPVEVRRPYGQPYTMQNYGKLLFNCNELPVGAEFTPAFFRRLLIVPFTETIPETEQDPTLAATIVATELSGVFNWVLNGLHRLVQQGGFTVSDRVNQQVEAYKIESDSVRSFLQDQGYIPSPDQTITRKELYPDYCAYCAEVGNRPVSSRHFARRLEHCGIQGTRRNNGHVHFLTRSFLSV